MYHYIVDKTFMNQMKSVCSDIVNQLVQSINNDSVIEVKANLVGSGAKNLITQNENEAVDLDYNLCIIKNKSINIRNGREIKEYIKKQFNAILQKNHWPDCKNSTSVLTTKEVTLKRGNKTPFYIDLAIICETTDSCYKLILHKTGNIIFDQYYWNEVPDSNEVHKKAQLIKSNHRWAEVRKRYLAKKNFYLCKGDHNHPSFIVYVETVNEVYYKYFR